MSYSPRILNETGDLDGVRYLAGLTERQLPDAAILSPALLPGVEAKAILSIPGYATLAADYKIMLRSAVTKITAAWALVSLPESIKSLDVTFTQGRDEQVDRLLKEAASEIGEIPGSEPTYSPSDLVRVSGPTRTAKLSGYYGWIYPV